MCYDLKIDNINEVTVKWLKDRKDIEKDKARVTRA